MARRELGPYRDGVLFLQRLVLLLLRLLGLTRNGSDEAATASPRPSASVEPLDGGSATDSRTAVLETLWCEPGQHEWTRARTSGRKPLACPDHRRARPKP